MFPWPFSSTTAKRDLAETVWSMPDKTVRFQTDHDPSGAE